MPVCWNGHSVICIMHSFRIYMINYVLGYCTIQYSVFVNDNVIALNLTPVI